MDKRRENTAVLTWLAVVNPLRSLQRSYWPKLMGSDSSETRMPLSPQESSLTAYLYFRAPLTRS
jgi:hypothetical protein